MERYQVIVKHPDFQYHMEQIKKAEQDRIFCKHNMEHLLNVARISYILVLEEGLPISKDLVYATALLHDLGKAEQYKNEIPHELGSASLAKPILKDCGYDEIEREFIIEAILNHRTYKETNTEFEKIFYRADKLSRSCRDCPAIKFCNWPDHKKNFEVII